MAKDRVAGLIGWMSLFAAFWSLLEFLFRFNEPLILDVVGYGLTLINVIHGPSLFIAGIMMVFASAAFRRKRLVVWLMVTVQLLILIGTATNQVFDILGDDVFWPFSWTVNVVAALVIIGLMLWARSAFPSPISARAAGLGVLALIGSQLVVILIGFLAVELVPNRLFTVQHRFTWVIKAVGWETVIGDTGLPHGGPVWLTVILALLSGAAYLWGMTVFLRAQRPPARTALEDLQLHELLARYPSDSLSYFATSTDRRMVFAPSSKACISYSVSAGVAMAGGDPVGDPAHWSAAIHAWLKHVYSLGLVPAALSCSEKGARAWRSAGFKARLMGDEAVIDISRFSLSDPAMKPLAAARKRVAKAGITITCRRLETLSAGEITALRQAAEKFRVGDERGFSMALDRPLDPLDFNQMVVTAYSADGQLHGLLTFVPFTPKGLSLNLMRRNPGCVNGTIEAMVLALIDDCRDRGIESVSLNFAMFRNVFVEGEAVDARWFSRALRRVMQTASHFWQLESLLEANARYRPDWKPRYIVFPDSARLTSTLVAAGQLEGFLPAWLDHRFNRPDFMDDPAHAAAVREIYDKQKISAASVGPKLGEQEKIRIRRAGELAAAGMDPYPYARTGEHTLTIAELVGGKKANTGPQPATPAAGAADGDGPSDAVTFHGRISAVRDHGGLVFADLFDGYDSIQMAADQSSTRHFRLLKKLDTGDAVSITGHLGRSDHGELTVFATDWRMLAKTLRPVAVPRTRFEGASQARDRTMTLINQPRQLQLVRMRSRAVTALRHQLTGAGYLEVETPILHAVKGGANARPFITHLNAYDAEVTLRIAPELYLKRLAVGGMGAIFEIGRSFRNEGVDATHNPEFTSLEAYRAGGDYTTMRQLTKQLITQAAATIHGREVAWQDKAKVERFAADPLPFARPLEYTVDPAEVPPNLRKVFTQSKNPLVQVDISGDWPVVSVLDAVSAATGRTIDLDMDLTDIAAICRDHGIEIPPSATVAGLVNELYEELVEGATGFPTFYTDFPAEGCPLTRTHRTDPRLAERWDLVAFGMELGTAYTELTDPRDQRERFVAQSLAAAAGDPEAMSLDVDFLRSLELGLVPTGGMGMGVDRMVMLLCGTDIRSIIAFPYVKPAT
nr:bifunctional lysylphosphatidylglycerol synthetase/lysine--tRNA ligase LysX [Corynebacterium mendelii]